jgi:hypothetical protein
MDSSISRAEIDQYRAILKQFEPYTEEELSVLDREVDSGRRQATFAKNILESYGLSTDDENDYRNID